MRTGIANLPLHYGKAPPWLFKRMRDLSREIATFIVREFGDEELLRRLSDPVWFQAFGSVLGFDWHSSGVTTTVCGALKEGLRQVEGELGIFVAGGKGKASRKTPSEIEERGWMIRRKPESLTYASRMVAKVDSSGVQDGYQLYHHAFFFTKDAKWCVVQQGMNPKTRYARRYHWLSEEVGNFVCEPHSAICCDLRGETLNMVASESGGARALATSLSKENPDRLIKELRKLRTLDLPAHHQILLDDVNPQRLKKIFISTYERSPENFETLLGMRGVGPKTIRALSLISELVYGVQPSYRDPARFAFAHGGKDGHPYPVDRENYDKSIHVLKEALGKAKVGNREKMEAIRRLGKIWH